MAKKAKTMHLKTERAAQSPSDPARRTALIERTQARVELAANREELRMRYKNVDCISNPATARVEVADLKGIEVLRKMLDLAITYTWDHRNSVDGDFLVFMNDELLSLAWWVGVYTGSDIKDKPAEGYDSENGADAC